MDEMYDVVFRNTSIQYFKKGTQIKHRIGGPAIIWDKGEAWYVEGKKHRKGKPATWDTHGNEWWYYEDRPHRDDGPAYFFKSEDSFQYYIHGVCHRIDGPAVKTEGGEYKYFLHGEKLNEEESALMEMIYEQ